MPVKDADTAQLSHSQENEISGDGKIVASARRNANWLDSGMGLVSPVFSVKTSDVVLVDVETDRALGISRLHVIWSRP